jgi:thiol-disulfide isomerase/thioredoxin
MDLNSIRAKAQSLSQCSFTYVKTNWMIIVSVLLFGVLGYYIYTNYVSNKTLYNADRDTIDSNQQSNKSANLMLFYVDWCPHCKTAKPEWENLKSEYEGKQINGYNLVISEFNCTAETSENE